MVQNFRSIFLWNCSDRDTVKRTQFLFFYDLWKLSLFALFISCFKKSFVIDSKVYTLCTFLLKILEYFISSGISGLLVALSSLSLLFKISRKMQMKERKIGVHMNMIFDKKEKMKERECFLDFPKNKWSNLFHFTFS